ncbi:MAG: hypothetical protein O2951_04750 [Bacteroidetes bacterium]|nr:hypothetical protein [Bacteroidota bacterium]
MDEPRISYNNLIFKETPANNEPDSLILFFDFQDGDGDIGLFEDESNPPFHDFDFIIDNNNFLVTFSGNFETPFKRLVPTLIPGPQNSELIRLNSEFFSDDDNRPPNWDCQEYVIDSMREDRFPVLPYEDQDFINILRDTIRDENGDIEFDSQGDPKLFTVLDTFYVVKNQHNKNIDVNFYRKTNGIYEFIDWARIFDENGCGLNFNARFPIFAPERIGKSTEGTIKYAMLSNGFRLVLRNDTFQIRTTIRDRALNTSNTTESPDLTLQQIGG